MKSGVFVTEGEKPMIRLHICGGIGLSVRPECRETTKTIKNPQVSPSIAGWFGIGCDIGVSSVSTWMEYLMCLMYGGHPCLCVFPPSINKSWCGDLMRGETEICSWDHWWGLLGPAMTTCRKEPRHSGHNDQTHCWLDILHALRRVRWCTVSFSPGDPITKPSCMGVRRSRHRATAAGRYLCSQRNTSLFHCHERRDLEMNTINSHMWTQTCGEHAGGQRKSCL